MDSDYSAKLEVIRRYRTISLNLPSLQKYPPYQKPFLLPQEEGSCQSGRSAGRFVRYLEAQYWKLLQLTIYNDLIFKGEGQAVWEDTLIF